MKNQGYWVVLAILLLSTCEGKLSDQQRKEMMEARKLQEIKIVTDAEITEAALAQGKFIMEALGTEKNSLKKTDSLALASHSVIRWLEPGTKNAKLIENQLIEAYLVSAATGGSQENIQQTETDSLIYTKPVLQEMPDGSIYVKGMWSIWFSKKQIVASINKN